jgi:hypothetical protein
MHASRFKSEPGRCRSKRILVRQAFWLLATSGKIRKEHRVGSLTADSIDVNFNEIASPSDLCRANSSAENGRIQARIEQKNRSFTEEALEMFSIPRLHGKKVKCC